MYTIVHKRALNPSVTWMDIEAPFIARKAKAGQFVILRVNETGERIPLTIASADPEKGTVTIIFQKVGKTTLLLDTLEEGDALAGRAAGRCHFFVSDRVDDFSRLASLFLQRDVTEDVEQVDISRY